MTSETSSKNNKRHSLFFTRQRTLLARRGWVIAVSAVLQVILNIVATPIRILYESSEQSIAYATLSGKAFISRNAYIVADQMGISPAVCLITLFLSVLIAHQGFSYLFSRREIDFFWSLPMKRRSRFFNIYINGFFIYEIPYLLSVFLGILISCMMKAMTMGAFVFIIYSVIRQTVVFLAVYSIAVLAVMLTGTEIFAFLMTGFLFVAELAVRVVDYTLKSAYFVTFNDQGKGIPRLLFSPVYFYIKGISGIDVMKDNFGRFSVRKALALDWKNVALIFIIGLVSVIIAYVFFTRRRAEHAGRGIVFRPVAMFVKIYCAIISAVLTGEIFDRMFMQSGNISLSVTIITLVIAVILVSGFAEAILDKSIKRFFHRWPDMLLSGVVAMFILCFFRYDLGGYNTYVPSKDKISSAEIEMQYTDNNDPIFVSDTKDFRKYSMKLTDIDDVRKVASVSQKYMVKKEGIISGRNETHDSSEDGGYLNGWYANVTWHMKKGQDISRQMIIPYDIDTKAMNRIIGSDAYRNAHFALDRASLFIDAPTANVTYKNVYGSSTLKTDGNALKDFLAAYREDLIQYDFSFATMNAASGQVEWNISGNDGMQCEYDIYPSFTNTIAYLRKIGVYLEPKPDLTKIGYITVTWFDLNDPGKDVTVKYKNREKIRSVLKYCTTGASQSDWYLANQSGGTEYSVDIHLSADDVINTVSFIDNRPPAMVVSDINRRKK
jgi:ABC-2 type transport system permease protein